MPIDPSIAFHALPTVPVQSAAETLGQVYQLRNAGQTEQLNRYKLEEAQRQQQTAQQAQQVQRKLGELNPNMTPEQMEAAIETLDPELRVPARTALAGMEETRQKMKQAKALAEKAGLEVDELQWQQIYAAVRGVRAVRKPGETTDNPVAAYAALSQLAKDHPEQAKQFWDGVGQGDDPEKLTGVIDQLLARAGEETTVLPYGATLVGKTTGRTIAEGATPPVKTDMSDVDKFGFYMASVAREAKRPLESFTPAEIESYRKRFEATTWGRPPQPPSGGDAGVLYSGSEGPVIVNKGTRVAEPVIDARTGKPIEPFETAQERNQQRAYARAVPVYAAINELSEKINTGKGILAKAVGAAEKAKAQVNLNDDVAEYQALIDAYSPLVARALGHTGVLTQVDVDSAKAMFPAPGDSKSLRDRKIARLTDLMAKISSSNPAGAETPTATGTTTVGGFTIEEVR